MFQPGDEILIKRSNGRVHSAMAVTIKGNLIQVEWEEAGETKAKEVSLREVMELNGSKENQSFSSASSRSGVTQPLPRITVNQRHAMAPPVVVAPRVTMVGEITTRRNAAPVAPPRSKTTSNSATAAICSNRESKDIQAARKSAAVPMFREPRPPKINRPTMAPLIQPQTVEPKNAADRNFLHMIEDYRSTLKRPATSTASILNKRITVAVRKRPMNKKELSKQEIDIVTIPSKDLLILHEPKLKVDLTPILENSPFRFDYSFDESADNEFVYKNTAKPLVKSIFEGGMATCFAYGQTGSGKTHTMGGSFVIDGKGTQQVDKGIYYFAARDVFAMNASAQYAREGFIVSSSFFEIYSGKVFDLLNGKKLLRVMESKNQVQVVGLSETRVQTVQDVLSLIQQGNSCRTSGSTTANSNSSRSHAIFQLSLFRKIGRDMRLHGRFSLVDLAGNERASDTWKTNDHQGRREAADINKSLLALKECIRALGRRGSHLPFRQSRLTHILKDSFMGEKSQTCMIAMISPAKTSCDYTLNTLRYADRVKELQVEDQALNVLSDGEQVKQFIEDDPGDGYSKEQSLEKACIAVQQSEEKVLEDHQDLLADVELLFRDLQAARILADDPNYDVGAYTASLREALVNFDRVHNRVARMPEEINALEDALALEEQAASS